MKLSSAAPFARFIGLVALGALGCEDHSAASVDAATASASATSTTAATASAAPPAPKPPIVSVDDNGASVAGERMDWVGDMKGKLTVALTGNPKVAGEVLTLEASRDAKVPRVTAVVAAMKAAKAKGATVKTANRDLATLGVLDLSFDHPAPAACSVIGMIGKDNAITVWAMGGGSATRHAHGMAGPDLTLGSENMRKLAASCDSPIYFVSGDDTIKWGLVFDLAIAARGGEAGAMRAVQVGLVTSETPVVGHKVSE